MLFVLILFRVAMDAGHQLGSPAKLGPELDGTFQIVCLRVIRRHISHRSVLHHPGGARFPIQVGHEGEMPKDLMIPHGHRGGIKPVSEFPPFPECRRRSDQICPSGPWPIQEQFVSPGPDLGVPGHRLVVQVDVDGVAAKKYVGHTVLFRSNAELVFVPLQVLPAMCSPVGVSPLVCFADWRRPSLARLVHPARLRNTQSMSPLAPLADIEKRDLHSQRKLFLKVQIWKRTPENQTAGKRK